MRSSKVVIAFSTVLFILAVHAAVLSQGVESTGNGGLNTIQGRVYLPTGRTSDTSITVRLESLSNRTVSVFTDRSGLFSFRYLTPGNYTIAVDAGDNFLVAREYFTIDSEIQLPNRERLPPVPKIFNVPIYLQFKPNAPINNEVINAKYAAIPKKALEECQKGLELAREGKTDQALKAFRQAIILHQQFARPHTEIGKILIGKGKLDEALEEFRVALALDPSDFDAKLNYGIALMGARAAPDAEKELRAASELDKNAVTPHYYLGILFLQTRKIDAAQTEMEAAKLLKGEKDLPLVHRYLGGIYWGKGKYTQAADELEKYLQLVPGAKDADQTRKAISELRIKQN